MWIIAPWSFEDVGPPDELAVEETEVRIEERPYRSFTDRAPQKDGQQAADVLGADITGDSTTARLNKTFLRATRPTSTSNLCAITFTTLGL